MAHSAPHIVFPKKDTPGTSRVGIYCTWRKKELTSKQQHIRKQIPEFLSTFPKYSTYTPAENAPKLIENPCKIAIASTRLNIPLLSSLE